VDSRYSIYCFYIFQQEDFYEWGGDGTSSLVSSKNSQVAKLAAAAHNWRLKVSQTRKVSACFDLNSYVSPSQNSVVADATSIFHLYICPSVHHFSEIVL